MIEAAFPGTIKNGAVDRAALSRHVDRRSRGRWQAAGRPVHPLVADERREFLEEATDGADIVRARHPAAARDRATQDGCGGRGRRAPDHVQRERVLARPGMTEEKFDRSLLAPDERRGKACKSPFVVVTDKGLDHAREQVKMILACCASAVRAKAKNDECVKSFSTPKRRASSQPTAIASSKSAVSS